jgi:hypothetical protein
MHNHIGSLRYDHTGRKRKSSGLKTKRKPEPKFVLRKVMLNLEWMNSIKNIHHLVVVPSTKLLKINHGN